MNTLQERMLAISNDVLKVKTEQERLRREAVLAEELPRVLDIIRKSLNDVINNFDYYAKEYWAAQQYTFDIGTVYNRSWNKDIDDLLDTFRQDTGLCCSFDQIKSNFSNEYFNKLTIMWNYK